MVLDRNNMLRLIPGEITLAELRRAYFEKIEVQLDDLAWAKINKGSEAVAAMVAKGDAVYGINTGFGLLAQTRIPDAQLAQLQRNLVVSHSAGVGDDLGEQVVRLIMILKINSLSQGHSGIRREVVELLLAILNSDVIPCIPAKGSVGASGDLAPLAHMSCTVIGVGDAYFEGRRMSAVEALAAAGLKPIELGAKEGLALLNGTQTSTALTLAGLFEAENLYAAAVVAGAMSVDGLKGSTVPFDPRLHELRRQPGQIKVAEKYLALLRDSEILSSHLNCDKVQDPYSLRCQPQIMGAALDIMNNAAATLENEANAVTDNPLIFPETLEGLSGGNFHAEPIAMAADCLAIAIAEIGSVSERRTAILVDPKMSGLPAFLVENSGLNSGFMIAQVTAAALASENKTFAHPASVDSLPTSANQEDHVSMATFAGRRLGDMNKNSMDIVAIELLSAAQALELHAPCLTSKALQKVLAEVRKRVAHYDKDRYFSPDIIIVSDLVRSGYFYALISDILPSGKR
ncbi:MAG: histidine ammonia-lyase [Candidatus Azotimanducaceae bacterium]|jgi:histidine ammonia-lyase